jgi:hypothetical protein
LRCRNGRTCSISDVLLTVLANCYAALGGPAKPDHPVAKAADRANPHTQLNILLGTLDDGRKPASPAKVPSP